MNFVLYPHVATEHFEAIAPKRQLVRIFVGQLPYNVTEMQLAWILSPWARAGVKVSGSKVLVATWATTVP